MSEHRKNRISFIGLIISVLLTSLLSSSVVSQKPDSFSFDKHVMINQLEKAENITDWTNMPSTTAPSARFGHAMAYDKESDRVILFGGVNSDYHHDTWAYDSNLNTWINKTPTTMPCGRVSHAMAYDAESDRVILFGGAGQKCPLLRSTLADTWAYDFNSNTWTNMSPSINPPPSFGYRLAYDIESDRVILFGGANCTHLLSKTWAYDHNSNTWIDMNPTTKPPPLSYYGLTYDVESDRVILFGGIITSFAQLSSETWAYDFNSNTWTNMKPITKLSIRAFHDMAYDVESDRVIIFGGITEDPPKKENIHLDTWVYDFNTNTWTNMTSTIHPTSRWFHSLTYDEKSDRIILFGGATGEMIIHNSEVTILGINNETWMYDYIPVQSTTTTPTPGWNILLWFLSFMFMVPLKRCKKKS